MTNDKGLNKYVAFLRGINVGGHHKVPMAELRGLMEELGYGDVVTLLNSGNVIFVAQAKSAEQLEMKISKELNKRFGFPIPTIIRSIDLIVDLLRQDPFQNIELTKDIRLYISFLHQDVEPDLVLPWMSEDNSFRIISKEGKTILSILDLSISNTPDAMKALEGFYGKDMTTRNWKTIKRIEKKLDL